MTNQTSRAKTDAHHKEVAEAIIKMIEGGTAPWQKPWDGNASAMMLMPFNGASKRRYRGINSLYLYTVANFKGYKDPRWFTFKQVEELGGKVKRGEKSVKVEYWQFKRTIKEDENGKPLAKEDWLEVDRKVPLIMRSAVFNAEQCEGIPELELPKRDWEPLERADTIMKASGVPVFHDAVDRNYYSPGSDEIHLTPMEAFPTREAYYGTALHELGHSTGHEKRLNRQFGKTFGDENYAKEELRAEIASFMLCSDLGISRQASDEQHAAYVGSWVKALKSDPNEIFKASADAENICNYLYDREREYMKNLGNEIEPNVPNNSVNYPEIEPSVTKVAEQVAGYGVPEFNRPEEMNKSNLSEIDTFFSTNYVSRADGSRMNVYVVDGKTYLGKSQNVMFEDGVDEAGRSVTHRYYDNADGSLIYLSDKAKMATFIADRSYGLPQDRMSNIGSYDFDDVLEAQHHEISRLFLDYSFAKDRLPELNDNLIKINSAAISNFEFGGKQLNVFVKDDAVYVGLRERYFTRGVYDNSDYTLTKVSDNRKMFHLLQGTGYVDSQEKMLAQELFSERDFIEYAELKAGALKKFEQVRELTFDGVPFKSPLAENEPVKGATEMDKGKVDYLHAYHTNFAENGERKSTFIMDGKAYLGNYKNIKMEPGKDDVGNDVMVRYYDNRDGSLVKLSDNPRMADLISERSLGYGKEVIMETYEGEFSDKDFEEYNKIFDEHLSKLEFTFTYEDMGRFDIKEAMKMVDEQVNGQVNEIAKEFNPPSDAQLALAESLHCKYKEDVSREDLAKIIAKTMEARKKYYEAINQPAKETQLDVLKEAGIEVKDGLTIGQASKMIAELPASTNQKVFMDRLKIEYAPEITRGEVEKLIKGKMKELEARENEPASEKTREFMKSRGIEVPEKLTRGEASKLIYNSAPTAKQMAFITNHKIECDKEKLTYGKASILIDKRLKYIDEQAKLPATEKQIKRLEKEKIEYAPEITRGEANKLINKAVMEKLQVSEKQIKYANDLGLEIPENATKAEVTKLIGEKVKANRIDKIADFEVPKDRKLTLSEGYYKLAQKYLEKGNEIDDKKIAASLLKDGHRDCDVKSVIHKNSPNCVNDLSKAQGYVNEAKKLPSVKKALEKENSR